MANNLRKFVDNAAYSAATLVKPAVSLIADTDAVYFDPKEVVPPTVNGDISLTFNITNASQDVNLWHNDESGGVLEPANMWVDGVEVTPVNSWRFSTTGEHTVVFEISDGGLGKSIPEKVFNTITMTNAIIGDDVVEIDGMAFYECPNLTSVKIGSGITYIGSEAFRLNDSLESVIIEATTPPTLGSSAFASYTNNYPIYVPAASVQTYKTATGWSTYATRIFAIPS